MKWRKSRAGESETAEGAECGSGWSAKRKKKEKKKKGSFGPYKVTLLQAHNAGELQPP